MSMFTNYDNLPSSYTPDNLTPRMAPNECYVPTIPYLAYNANGDVIGYKWSYGDTVNLNFDISGRVLYDVFGFAPYNESISTYMGTGNQHFVFRIYDMRFEQIYETQPNFICNKNGTVEVSIPIFDTLAKKLVRGKYELSLSIEGVQENPLYATDPTLSKTVKVKQTILKPEDCNVYIM